MKLKTAKRILSRNAIKIIDANWTVKKTSKQKLLLKKVKEAKKIIKYNEDKKMLLSDVQA